MNQPDRGPVPGYTYSEHMPVRVYLERPGEISWVCACGTHNKHQWVDAHGSVNLICGEMKR